MVKVWETDLTSGAVANCNIKLEGSPFFLAPFTGGSNEKSAPKKLLTVSFKNGSTERMWVYGDKKILTPRTEAVSAFFSANNIKADQSVRLRITQTTLGELLIERAI